MTRGRLTYFPKLGMSRNFGSRRDSNAAPCKAYYLVVRAGRRRARTRSLLYYRKTTDGRTYTERFHPSEGFVIIIFRRPKRSFSTPPRRKRQHCRRYAEYKRTGRRARARGVRTENRLVRGPPSSSRVAHVSVCSDSSTARPRLLFIVSAIGVSSQRRDAIFVYVST